VTAALVNWLRKLIGHIAHGVTVTITWARGAWERILTRHRDRLADEPGYSTSLAAGLTALVGTITATPAVAAAVGVWIAESLRAPGVRGRTRYGAAGGLWDADWDEDLEDEPRPWLRRR
jgi:hypothetical protein